MRRVQRLSLAVVCCLTFLLAFASWAMAAEEDRNAVMSAYHKLAAAETFHMRATTRMSMSVLDKEYWSNMDSEMDIQVQPLLCRSTTKVIANMDGTIKNEARVDYMEASGKRILIYTNKDDKWERLAIPIQSYNPTRDCGDFVKTLKTATLISQDDNTQVYEVMAEGKYLKTIIKQKLDLAGANKVDAMGLTEALVNAVDDVTFYITVDRNTEAISGLDIDFSQFAGDFMKQLLNKLPLPEDKKQEVDNAVNSLQFKMSYTYSQLNSIDPISIPDEARE